MQDAIRSADEQHFPHLDRFQSYKADGDLLSARKVALKYLKIIQEPQNFQEVIFSVRDF